MNEITFLVEEAPEGGYAARALGVALFTEADSREELHPMVRDAMRCHHEEEECPTVIRLHRVRQSIPAR